MTASDIDHQIQGLLLVSDSTDNGVSEIPLAFSTCSLGRFVQSLAIP